MQTQQLIFPLTLRLRRVGCLVTACVFLTFAPVASAQDEEARANARAAAHAGADAFDAGDYVKAIAFFERAESQFHSPVHLWYVARAAHKAGHLVKAREACLKVTREGAGSDASSSVVQANEECAEILEELEGAIASLTITVEGVPSGATFKVFRNGEEVPQAVIGIPAPMDPGDHAFTASLDGYSVPEQKISLKEGDKQAITLTFVQDKSNHSDSSGEGSAALSGNTSDGGLPRPYWPAFTAWGVGLGGIGMGVFFGLSSQSKAKEADDLCGGSRTECFLDEGSSDAGRVNDLNDQAGANQTIALISYGVGGAMVATGVVFWLLEVGGPKKTTAANRQLQPIVGPSHLGLRGTF